MKNLLRDTYDRLKNFVERGLLEDASLGANELRQQGGSDAAFLRALISSRLKLKRGEPIEHEAFLSTPKSTEPSLRAEAHFVLGLNAYTQNSYPKGVSYFLAASEDYHRGQNTERELLSIFNALIGLSNDSQLQSLEQLEPFRELARLGERHNLARIEGLARRQLALIFHEAGRLQASLHEGSLAIAALEKISVSSDLQLALLQQADCLIDQQDLSAARLFWEKASGPHDARVQFPFAYIDMRLNGTPLRPEDFSVILPHWRKKCEERNALSSSSPLPVSGLSESEKKIIRWLQESPRSKDFLCESLWPEHGETSLLNNRLHKTLSRLNKKIDQRLYFDGSRYRIR